ncbi:FERM and PDZ domain-containing protein 1 isoform X2 [Rhinatrema bivittatum]|uniref:FERM and PDZ domain-containing protein 1 isoform X2 n=1 Tax=Rhinatrema bivittatum TaxID=194408 RepID=UPI001127351B|nr:FERM and PDZ domain-containing protein 1 isoform X2 [Rhinatrema bivittatum]
MEEPEANLLQSRKVYRIEQMVARWLRRSRDSSYRSRTSVANGSSGIQNQFSAPVKLTVTIYKDLLLNSYGFDISQNPSLTIASLATGGPAEGKLLPGDQILRINNEVVEDVSIEQATDLISKSDGSVSITVLRYTSGPKSSFLTAEKRARLKSNPVKVRFAEEVIVNGHAQGNSLLFMPNVLKVYLENGQTKAFKFETKTTVKDIILTLKEKLSIHSIEHFALALEEQYNISKLYLLHEDELIEQVVQKRESHDYRCLFRVCFVPRDPWDLLQEDPVAFEYLYLQSCSDVLQERFAVEMKCSMALRLAALHIHERILACAQPQKISFKYIEKDWGIENFISPTLLRNMRGKDIKKAISFHMKRNQSLLEPRQKQLISAAQVRINYLKILGELKSYGGKVFSATLLLQDRELYVTLLVGAKYGISQIVNNKLNIMTTLAEFSNISRVELSAESEKVSMMKVYLQDVKPLSLLLESNNAKDLACLITGYYKLFVDSSTSVFSWGGPKQVHRFSAEEGYESRGCSDSEESSEIDSSLDVSSDTHLLKYNSIKPLHEEEEELDEIDGKQTDGSSRKIGFYYSTTNGTDSASEASDSANTEGRGCVISWSSDSMDALEEDDLEACSSSKPEFFHFYAPSLDDMHSEDKSVFYTDGEEEQKENDKAGSDPFLCFLQSGADQREFSRCPEDMESREDNELSTFSLGCRLYDSNVMEYYNLCSNVSPANSLDQNYSPDTNSFQSLLAESEEGKMWDVSETSEVEMLILEPPPGFGDSSSEEEFFDAADRLTPTETSSGSEAISEDASKFTCLNDAPYRNFLDNYLSRQNKQEKTRREKETKKLAKNLRKRRSFLQTDYTSQVSFPFSPSYCLDTIDHVCCYEKEPCLFSLSHSPTISSLKDTEGEPALLETKQLAQFTHWKETKSKKHTSNLMEMEPDTMEIKSLTDAVVSSISAVRVTGQLGEKPASYCKVGVKDNKKPCIPLCLSVQEGTASPSEISCPLNSIATDDQGGQFEVAGRSFSEHHRPLWETNYSATRVVECSKGNRMLKEKGAEFHNVFDDESQAEMLRSYIDVSFGPLNWETSRQALCPAEEAVHSKSESKNGKKPMVSSIKIEKTGNNQCIISKGDEASVQEKSCKNLQEESFRKVEDKKCLGSSNEAEMLFDSNGISGIFPHFPILSGLKESKSRIASCFNSQQTGPLERGEGEPFLGSTDSNAQVLDELLPEVSGQYMPTPSESFQSMQNPPEPANDQRPKDTGCRNDQLWLHMTPPRTEERTLYRSQQPLLEPFRCFPGCGNTSGATREDPSTAPVYSKQLLFCFGHKRDTKIPANSSMDSSLDYTSIKNVIVSKDRMEKCSCQLSYAACFHGLDTELDDENVDSEDSASPSLPLTIPPSSGSLSVERNPLKLHDGNKDEDSELQANELLTGPEHHLKALNQLQGRTYDIPADFSQLQNNVVELQKVLQEFSDNGLKHPQDKCAMHFSEEKYKLCAESRKLISSCQKVIKAEQSPELMRDTVRETFQNLLQLTRVCFQFTDGGCCISRKAEVLADLRHVVCTYNQFVQAARKACEKGCPDPSIQLLSPQCTALTAAVFCLTQQFRTLTLP